MPDYQTIRGISTFEYEEKRSRFIASAAFADTEEAALAHLNRIKAANRTARHNVYAYVLREGGRTRYSDDGEPAKTAGTPVLEAIGHAGLSDVIVVVTRYFGGVLLGTGGLVRTYTAAASGALQQAEIVSMRLVTDCAVTVSYPKFEQAQRMIAAAGAKLQEPEYAEKLKSLIKDIHISFRLNPETGRPDTYLNGVNVENKIRTMEVSSRVSPIATLDFVREAMVAQQQEMGKAKGIVMDGRDIGTTVFPDAELKIFVTATPEIRAQRRYDELKAKGEEASFDEILENVKQRDYIDQNRDVSPLRKASDALLLDNSHLSISQQKEWLAEQFERVIKEKN